MFDEKDENLAKFVDAVYFTSQSQQLYQSSLYVHDNGNKIGKIGSPIVSKEIDKIYQQLASWKMSTSFQRNQDSSSSSDEYKQQQQQRQHSGAWKPKKKNIQQNFHFSKSDYCSFCKNNGEKEEIYKSHNLRDNQHRVECPRLRDYKCKICGAFGDYAHTIRYCPRVKCSFATKSVHTR